MSQYLRSVCIPIPSLHIVVEESGLNYDYRPKEEYFYSKMRYISGMVMEHLYLLSRPHYWIWTTRSTPSMDRLPFCQGFLTCVAGKVFWQELYPTVAGLAQWGLGVSPWRRSLYHHLIAKVDSLLIYQVHSGGLCSHTTHGVIVALPLSQFHLVNFKENIKQTACSITAAAIWLLSTETGKGS